MVLDRKKRDIIFRNFLGGIAWGLGSVIGATVVVAIIGGILTWLGVISLFAPYFPQK